MLKYLVPETVPVNMNMGEMFFTSLLIFSLCEMGKTDCFPFGKNGFECRDKTCILKYLVCDGETQCPDGSDELQFDNMTSTEKERGFRCPSGCYLPEQFKCDQHNHCIEDECGCSFSNPIRCASDGACISERLFCDGYNWACSNNEDEMRYTESMKNEGEFLKCFTGNSKHACALPAKYHKCDGIRDCLHGGDECFCNDNHAILDHECFRCLDGQGEMVRSHLCNGFFDCADLSDECLCENPPSICKQLVYREGCEFQCKLPIGDHKNFTLCINRTQVCNEKKDCPYGEDEKHCSSVNYWKERISELYADERLPELWCCNAGYPADCLDESSHSNEFIQGCDQFYKCPADKFAEYFKYAIKCDGVPMCRAPEEEFENCTNASSLAAPNSKRSSDLSCPESNGTISIERNAFCNGVPDCDKDQPNSSSDEQNCKNRFYCISTAEKKTLISIKKSQVCDCIANCDDASDEANCTHYTRFCCSDGQGALNHDQVCNGADECFDRSDECQNCIQSPFADDQHLISNSILSALVWIIGIISFFGNSFVFIRTCTKLWREKLTVMVRVTLSQVLILSVADFSVGVYLISLGIANGALSGIYCYEDSWWRSGRFCNFLGVLSMFGMQASVFTLTIMTVTRLLVVARPFQSVGLWKHRIPVITLLLLAFALATIPVVPALQDYFTSYVKLTRNPFLGKEVSRAEFSEFANKLVNYRTEEHDFREILGEKKDLYPWTTLFAVMKLLNESFKPQFKFGYYSTHGVCLPKFFPATTDSAWEYSFFVIIVNLILFISIAISYFFIFRITATQRRKAHASQHGISELASLQRRITRIIATDFCCWIPICLIGFVKVGGVIVSDEAYAVAAVVLLPINSALNPFLYSDMPEFLREKCSEVFTAAQKNIRRSSATAQTVIHKTTSSDEEKTLPLATIRLSELPGNESACWD